MGTLAACSLSRAVQRKDECAAARTGVCSTSGRPQHQYTGPPRRHPTVYETSGMLLLLAALASAICHPLQ